MKGKLYGVGVGPGDPELMTLKAVRIIKSCPVIAVPAVKKETSMAYKIASSLLPLESKEILEIPMPMTKDQKILSQYHELGSKKIEDVLSSGCDVAFLMLGDPTIYATYGYLYQRIEKKGYETEMISGVPSFCAAAARLNISLAEGAEQIHMIPGSYEWKDMLTLPGTKIFMKAGSKIKALKQVLIKTKNQKDAYIWMVENCGMENETCCYCADEINENAGYYSIVIVKDNKNTEKK